MTAWNRISSSSLAAVLAATFALSTDAGTAIAGNKIGNVTNNNGIITQGQIGNNTIINLGEQIDAKILGQLPPIQNSDGTYTARIMISVHPQIPLLAKACGDDVLSVRLSIWTGMMTDSAISAPRDGNCETAGYDGVYGQWVVLVQTKSKDSKFTLQFERPD